MGPGNHPPFPPPPPPSHPRGATFEPLDDLRRSLDHPVSHESLDQNLLGRENLDGDEVPDDAEDPEEGGADPLDEELNPHRELQSTLPKRGKIGMMISPLCIQLR